MVAKIRLQVARPLAAPRGRRGRMLALFCLPLLGAAAAWTPAMAGAADSTDPLVRRREASYWINRIQRAAQHQNYVGTFVYHRGASMQSSQIAHYADLLGNEFERIESLDGRPRQMLRRNSELRTLRPDTHSVLIEHRDAKDSFPALTSTNKVDALDSYDVHLGGVERQAGVDCQLIELESKFGDRFTYRLWADRNSGLLVRAQTLGEGGRVLEQIGFSRVQIGVPFDKSRIQASWNDTAGWRSSEIQEEPVNLAEQGWSIVPPAKGFVKIREVHRPAPPGAPAAHAAGMFQVVFSDGMADVSVLLEPVVSRNARREGHAMIGATNLLTRRQGDFWVTVVGEVPYALLKQFSVAIEHKSAK